MTLGPDELELVIDGAALFGSGGGGSRDNAGVFLKDIRDRGVTIELVTEIPEDEKDTLACVICDIGSNSEFDPRQINALDFAFEALEKNYRLENAIKYVFPIESGPENTLAPIVLASRKNLKVVDADGGGRAVPKLSLTLFSFDDNQSRPAIMSNGLNDFYATATRVRELEKVLRGLVGFKEFNSSASLALWPESARSLKQKAFQGPIMRSYYCGMMLKGLRENDKKLIEEARPHLNSVASYFIGKGVVIDRDKKDDNGFDIIETTLYNDESDVIFNVFSQNENLVVYSNRDKEPLAIAPDSICYLDASFHALTNARVLDPMDNRRRHEPKKFRFLDGKENLQILNLIGLKAPPILTDNEDIMREFRGVLCENNITDPYKTPSNQMPLGDLLEKLKNGKE